MTANSKFWDQYAAIGYDALRILLPYQALQRDLLAISAPRPDERLFVAGCGTGNFEALAIDDCPELSVDAVDLSHGMLARAIKKCRGKGRVRHFQADLCEPLNYPDGSFDVALMCNVLYSLEDAPFALRSIRRILKPEGRLIVCDRYPGATIREIIRLHFRTLRTLSLGRQFATWARTMLALPSFAGIILSTVGIWKRHAEGDYALYEVEKATALLREAGFTVEHQQSGYAEQCWIIRARAMHDPIEGP